MKIVIHPGFGKSATTSLQGHFFGEHPRLLAVGRPFDELGLNLEFCHDLVNVDLDVEHVCEKHARIFDKKHDGKILILSEEKIVDAVYKDNSVVKRLKTFFPNANIVFTIRNQLTAIPSYYAAHGRMMKNDLSNYDGKHISFEEWLTSTMKDINGDVLGMMRYKPVIDIFNDSFGKKNVNVLLFEEYTKDLRVFCEKLSTIFELDVEDIYEHLQARRLNVRPSKNTIRYKKFREWFFPNFHPSHYMPYGNQLRNTWASLLARGKTLDVSYPKGVEETLAAYYKPDNTMLAIDFNLDLKKWGYPLLDN